MSSQRRLSVGTSGFSYKPWKGSFYPADMKDGDMLAFYSTQFDTVELNNTFYRLPNENTLRQWAEQVPPGFRFALKASRTITHIKRLKEIADPVGYLFRVTAVLGDALGPVLFGLPPNMKQDLDRLNAFVELIPEGVRAAVEFRHPSWHDDAVFDVLRSRNLALCIAQTDEDETPLVATADWGYIRLRREAYSTADLAAWLQNINAQPWTDTFVYLKHEDAGVGPRLARELLELAGPAASP
ncbi:DUF72 domain-containing protein [soil metagenome]